MGTPGAANGAGPGTAGTEGARGLTPRRASSPAGARGPLPLALLWLPAALLLAAAGCGGVNPPETWQGPPKQSARPAPPPEAGGGGAQAPAQEKEAGAGRAMPADYAAEVREFRKKKDELFLTGKESPVPPEQRGSFKGLDYYPVDPSWRLVLPLVRDGRPEVRTFVSNTGEKRQMRREGHVEFERDGVSVKLALYHILDDPVPENSLWLGFADAGSGKETYPGGRYIDTELRADGTVLLDFNYAYNPLCAYGWAFSCPLAPSENRVKIPIRAGEKGFHQP